jgi:hypothetical protein
MANIATPQLDSGNAQSAFRGDRSRQEGYRRFVGLAYVAGYVALDRISFIEPYAFFGITPWNPNTGLSIVLVLFFDIWMVPLLFVAPFMADLINRQINLP